MSGLSPETEELLARGREGEPMSPAHRGRLKRAVLAQVAAASVTTTATTAAAWSSIGVKVAGVVSAVVIAGTGLTYGVSAMRSHDALQVHAPEQMQNAHIANAPVIPPVPVMTAPVSTTARAAPAVTDAPAAAPRGARARDAMSAPMRQPDTNARTGAEATRVADTRAHAGAEARAGAEERAGAEARASTGTGAEAKAGADPKVQPPTASSNAQAPASTLAEEARLLRDAHHALTAGDPATALRLLDAHAAKFPSSALEPERSAERVFALCLANDTAAASAAAEAFLRAHPTGPLASRVRASCSAPH